MRWSIVLSFAGILACAGSETRPDPEQCDPPVTSDQDAVRNARPAPEGDGWCCVAALGFPSQGTYLGGFASDPCDCAGRTRTDAPTCVYHPYVDEHGCDAFRLSWSACGVPDAPDAGQPTDAASWCDGCGAAP